jgi:hypothetical protein
VRDFALALVTDIRNQSGYAKLFTARYSGELLAGNTPWMPATRSTVSAPKWSSSTEMPPTELSGS